MLGICLGSQLIAKTFGAEVYAGPRKEIGFYNDLMTNDNDSEFFSNFKNPFTVFHWHGETFDLPCGRNSACIFRRLPPTRLFAIKSAVGLQFHLEVNEDLVNLWLNNAEKELSKIQHIDPEKIRSEIVENISTVKLNMNVFYNNFKSFFDL